MSQNGQGLGCLFMLFIMWQIYSSVVASMKAITTKDLIIGGSTIIAFIVFWGLVRKGYFSKLFQQKAKPIKRNLPPEGFALWLGQTTGTLLARRHPTGLSENQDVWLSLQDAAQNIVVIGGIGSGKTTRIIQPLLHQFLSKDCGGLIFDIKGDFKNAVSTLAVRNNRRVEIIGIGGKQLNLIEGLSPEMASSFLKSAFYLNGGASGSDSFWIDTATELCKSTLGILHYADCYTLDGLYRYIFFDADRKQLTADAHNVMIDLNPRDSAILLSYLNYYEQVFSVFDEKVKRGVLASVAQVLSPFNHPDMIQAFCTTPTDRINLENVLNGSIFLVDLPLAHWGMGGKAVYTFIKLRFFNVLQSRSIKLELNQDRPVFFMCDEYQEIISANKVGISDLNFWDKSRSAKCIGIVSAQSVNSFRSAIGDDTLAYTILQNFRQKIFFRTEDHETLEYATNIAGKVEVQRTSYNTGSGQSKNSSDWVRTNKQENQGTSISWQERYVVDASLIRSLGPNQAICFYNINGRAADDLMLLAPLFID